MDDHSSGTPVAGRFAQPTRTAGAETPWAQSPRRPYSVLLPVGFALPPPLPEARCALAAPFHPCGQANPPRGIISVALSLGSPPPGVTRHRVSMEPGLSSPAPFRALRQRSSSQLAKHQVGAGTPEVNYSKRTAVPVAETMSIEPLAPIVS